VVDLSESWLVAPVVDSVRRAGPSGVRDWRMLLLMMMMTIIVMTAPMILMMLMMMTIMAGAWSVGQPSPEHGAAPPARDRRRLPRGHHHPHGLRGPAGEFHVCTMGDVFAPSSCSRTVQCMICSRTGHLVGSKSCGAVLAFGFPHGEPPLLAGLTQSEGF
jgi:hypothetical protein